jgi:hypothetical protein
VEEKINTLKESDERQDAQLVELNRIVGVLPNNSFDLRRK